MKQLAELFDLSGRVALVPGGSRGLGLNIAEALAEYGAKIFLVARKQHELDEAAAHLEAAGATVGTLAADLSYANAPREIVEAVMARFGRIDILVNNAGASWGAPAEDYPEEGWDKVLNLNVTALFRLTQIAAKRASLPQGKGSIINIASVEGLGAHHPDMIGIVGYNTAKGAVVNLTRALAAEWGPKNIRVNAIAPGYFPSKLADATVERHGKYLIHMTPLGKLGGPDDLKGLALLLASDASGHITGQIIVVDGGSSVI